MLKTLRKKTCDHAWYLESILSTAHISEKIHEFDEKKKNVALLKIFQGLGVHPK